MRFVWYTYAMHAERLLTHYPIITDQIEKQELRVILTELETLLGKKIPGDIVEFGCYAGSTSLFIQRLLIAVGATNKFHVYDSFVGLPEKQQLDESAAGTQFKAGELAVSKSDYIRNFKKARLPIPKIHKGWFEDLSNDAVPKHISFAFLDGDYYRSIMSPLKLIWNRLSPGAVVIVDDYQNEALPGASQAVDDWLQSHAVVNFRIQASLAVMIPATAQ